jgi:hypothetical protein
VVRRDCIDKLRFVHATVYAIGDSAAVGHVQAEGIVRATGQRFQQDYVFFLQSVDGMIKCLREYCDTLLTAKASGLPALTGYINVESTSPPASVPWKATITHEEIKSPETVSAKDYAVSRATLMTEVFKSLLLVNAGGAAALLLILKEVAITAPSKYGHLGIPIANAAIVMSIGLFIAVMSAFVRFWHSILAENRPGRPAQLALRIAYTFLMLASAGCFLAATVIIVSPVKEQLKTLFREAQNASVGTNVVAIVGTTGATNATAKTNALPPAY